MEAKGNIPQLTAHDGLAQPRIDARAILPDVSRRSLGRRLVRLDITAAIDEQRCEDTIDATESAGVNPPLKVYDLMNRVESRRETGPDLQIIRNNITGLEARNAGRFNWYCRRSVSPFLMMVKDGTEDNPKKSKDLSWIEWLGKEADDAQLLNFLQWHNYELAKVNRDPEITDKIEIQREEYKDAITSGITEGWLHPSARTAIEDIDDIRVYAGDMFETHFQGADGYHRRGSKEVVATTISNIPRYDKDYESIVRPLKWTAKHEFNHAVLGGFGSRWLDEALTEHIARVMDHGEPDVIDPDRRANKGGSYEYERSLLSTLLEKGRENVPVRMAMLAYSDKSKEQEAAEAFAEAIDRSWAHLAPEGQNAFKNLNYYIDALERQIMDEQKVGVISAGRQAAILTHRIFRQHPDGEKLREIFAGENYWQGRKITV